MYNHYYLYGKDHVLQTVAVTTLPETSLQDNSYWVILIHGGAWRDPTQTSIGYLTHAASILTSSPAYTSSTLPRIAAFASIEYRLSPHPAHPQDRHTTDPREYRAAKHPDHLADVQDALAFLQRKYGFGERYILVGHSCGATMAFQSVMGCLRSGGDNEEELDEERKVSPFAPTAILGMAGIYDLRLLRDTFRDVSAYQEIVEGAFGKDEAVWDAVSPAAVQGPSGVAGWKAGRLAVLAYSPEDGLVDPTQREAMRQALAPWEKGHSHVKSRRVELLSLTGSHDESWEKGQDLARAIAFTIDKLDD
ncbi:hypothetical protein P170DRAFT_441378 [Aspergillus steynii IBT 23096]|uniref:Kynurenine formamidase n=1 Tax=Aspergillus steynii IBT 23096 TaxID=1392250 RepID=A0A2I2FTH0_9EURO|nr:uncharacterized protein P170DRAFT_441378 [Aspergillus steynii IBT 23096]PLB43940.1 hypothetical protein P170DRAFT_441378 [Aspergillus steynii IBT 23096]